MRAALAALFLSAGAAAADCAALLERARAEPLPGYDLRAAGAAEEDGWCVARNVVLQAQARYASSLHIDQLRLRGTVTDWLAGAAVVPDSLDAEVEGLRVVVSMGDPRMDWILAAQSYSATIRGALSLRLTEDTLRLERLDVDFPGDNALSLTATVTGVGLEAPATVGTAALSAMDLSVTTHGLFEVWALMPLATLLLPPEGDVATAAGMLRLQAAGFVRALPAASVDQASKDALVVVLRELPNPAGRLDLSLRAEPGLGAVQLVGRVPENAQALAAQLLQGATLTARWTHGAAE